MTWYADEIILGASPAALKAVEASPQFASFAYHVRSLAGHDWYRPEQVHDLPEEGLLVIRPLCGTGSEGFEWHGGSVLDGEALPYDSSAHEMLDALVSQRLADYLGADSIPPQALRKAAATLASGLDQPVMYYSCAMWGGDIEYEYALIYEPAELLLLTVLESPQGLGGREDALRSGLARVGLRLPTAYFAPHTRSFPWQAHKIGV